MFKKIAFLCKKDGLSVQEFIDYYENHHVPLICRLAPVPAVYKRRYLMRGHQLNHQEDGPFVCDVVTELGFSDADAFRAWIARLSEPGVGEQVAVDEARFLDRARTRSFVVEEHITSE